MEEDGVFDIAGLSPTQFTGLHFINQQAEVDHLLLIISKTFANLQAQKERAHVSWRGQSVNAMTLLNIGLYRGLP